MITIILVLSLAANAFLGYLWWSANKDKANAVASQVEAEAKNLYTNLEGKK